MSWLDILFIVVFGIGAIKGYNKGFIIEIFSFIAFFLGLFLAIELTLPLANIYFEGSDHFYLLTVFVFIGVFIGVIFGVNLLARIIKKAVDLTFLGFFDNILGVIASVIKWAFIISVFFWVLDSIGFRLSESQMSDSVIFPWIKDIGPAIFRWVANILPFIRDMMDSMDDIGKKQRELYTFLQSFKYV
ncbi:MAG: CvpA family protein [Cyclobacteriaceae bacterium]|nr:CvpA family protein [Cyclobacteriaceae bacterium SS2]